MPGVPDADIQAHYCFLQQMLSTIFQGAEITYEWCKTRDKLEYVFKMSYVQVLIVNTFYDCFKWAMFKYIGQGLGNARVETAARWTSLVPTSAEDRNWVNGTGLVLYQGTGNRPWRRGPFWVLGYKSFLKQDSICSNPLSQEWLSGLSQFTFVIRSVCQSKSRCLERETMNSVWAERWIHFRTEDQTGRLKYLLNSPG